jgi:hypothetical protein
MKTSALFAAALASSLILVISPNVALAQAQVAPEPTAFLIWAGIAAAAGLVGWRAQRRS